MNANIQFNIHSPSISMSHYQYKEEESSDQSQV